MLSVVFAIPAAQMPGTWYVLEISQIEQYAIHSYASDAFCSILEQSTPVL